MMDDHELDELELANLTGVHGIVEKPAAAAAPAPGATPAPALPQVPQKEMHQTPQQAMKLAAALRDLRKHPVAPPSDRPVVVVHKHDYLRSLGVFLGFLLGGAIFAVIAVNLAADANLLNLPVRPFTNFF